MKNRHALRCCVKVGDVNLFLLMHILKKSNPAILNPWSTGPPPFMEIKVLRVPVHNDMFRALHVD